MIGDFPTALQSQNIESTRLLGTEIAQCRISHVIRLQVELVERGEELSDGADAFVGYVDAVIDRDRDETGMKTRPQTLLRYFVAAFGIDNHEVCYKDKL